MNRNRFLACFFLWGILVANGLLAGCMEIHHQSNTSTDKNTYLASDDLIDISAEYDYYPLKTTKVVLQVTNHSKNICEGRQAYTLEYYDEDQNMWEALPVDTVPDTPLLIPSGYKGVCQLVPLDITGLKKRIGKYRIGKCFVNSVKKHYAFFELVDSKGVLELRRRIDDYNRKGANDKTDTVAQNILMTYTQGDTIFVMLMNNNLRFQEMFRRKVLSYSSVSHGAFRGDRPLNQATYSDTLQIRMRTEHQSYPVGTETVSVTLTNHSEKTLFFGEDYGVVRKEGNQWILLNGNNSWLDIGIGVPSGKDYRFDACLYPIFNENCPGIYKVFKEISFIGGQEKWLMSAEFEIK